MRGVAFPNYESFAMWNGTQAVPYNNFTNYDAIICKRQKIILLDLLFAFTVI